MSARVQKHWDISHYVSLRLTGVHLLIAEATSTVSKPNRVVRRGGGSHVVKITGHVAWRWILNFSVYLSPSSVYDNDLRTSLCSPWFPIVRRHDWHPQLRTNCGTGWTDLNLRLNSLIWSPKRRKKRNKEKVCSNCYCWQWQLWYKIYVSA